jgi:hypothetical protein
MIDIVVATYSPFDQRLSVILIDIDFPAYSFGASMYMMRHKTLKGWTILLAGHEGHLRFSGQPRPLLDWTRYVDLLFWLELTTVLVK